jgi:hypothetical protein
LKNAWKTWKGHQAFLKEIQGQFQHDNHSFFGQTWTSNIQQSHDYPAEVFLQDGKISPPYLRSFSVCKIARWYCPDCIPGLISQIYDGRGITLVLYANEQYIDLCEEEELEGVTLKRAMEHFIRRGFDHLIDPTNAHVLEIERILNPGSWNKSYGYRGKRPQRDRVNVSWSTQNSSAVPPPGFWTTLKAPYACRGKEAKIGVDPASGNDYSAWTWIVK